MLVDASQDVDLVHDEAETGLHAEDYQGVANTGFALDAQKQ